MAPDGVTSLATHHADCVNLLRGAHGRPENGSLAVTTAAIQHRAGRTGPEFCTEARAAVLGALVFNRSDAPR